jgi:hypothetical protein
MNTAKIAISLDKKTLMRLDRLVKTRIFPSRSKIIQDAVVGRGARAYNPGFSVFARWVYGWPSGRVDRALQGI